MRFESLFRTARGPTSDNQPTMPRQSLHRLNRRPDDTHQVPNLTPRWHRNSPKGHNHPTKQPVKDQGLQFNKGVAGDIAAGVFNPATPQGVPCLNRSTSVLEGQGLSLSGLRAFRRSSDLLEGPKGRKCLKQQRFSNNFTVFCTPNCRKLTKSLRQGRHLPNRRPDDTHQVPNMTPRRHRNDPQGHSQPTKQPVKDQGLQFNNGVAGDIAASVFNPATPQGVPC